MRITYSTAPLAFVLLIAACTERVDGSADTASTRDAATAPTDGGMQDMTGMQAMPMTGGMTMNQMHAHMMVMERARGDSLVGMVSMHRQMAANMLARMNREMSSMNMAADARWTATVDSLRQDLARMPELSAAEMQRLMPAHHARMMRLMEMHRAMMGAHVPDTSRR